ncbi:DUF45 domain-containing protein [Candidatus Saccharibacteria bacterium]|nr:DUF45 domain-containing protein [Candidatus Saccharibacteria bacterium]
MAQQLVQLDGVGELHLSKRRGQRNLRLSINSQGRIRVSQPHWLPYRVGLEFAKRHQTWISKKLAERPASIQVDGRQSRRRAELVLPKRLAELARKHNYKYRQLKLRKLSARWGSCSSRGDITLSYLLVELPDEFADYVMLHELVHTRHLNHSQSFWRELESALPQARQLQRRLRQSQPAIEVV